MRRAYASGLFPIADTDEVIEPGLPIYPRHKSRQRAGRSAKRVVGDEPLGRSENPARSGRIVGAFDRFTGGTIILGAQRNTARRPRAC